MIKKKGLQQTTTTIKAAVLCVSNETLRLVNKINEL